MKKLVAPGIVLQVTTKWRAVHPARVRVFSSSPYAHNLSPGVYEVAEDFTLKSGTRYFYHYRGQGTAGYIVGLVNNLMRVPPPLIGGLLGGKLFNAVIRPNTYTKSTSPP